MDPWFIVHSAPDQTPLIQTARSVNNSKPNWVVRKAIQAAKPSSTITCLGLSYKSDIDDLRESPAIEVIKELATQHSGPIIIAEPNVMELPSCLKGYLNIELSTYKTAIRVSEIIIVLTDHIEFKNVSLSELENKILIDTRGIWHKKTETIL